MIIITRPCRFHARSFTFIGSIALLASAGMLALASTAVAEIPRGVFSIASNGKKIQDPILINPNVDGISLRQNWADIEKTEGIYDWTYLDGQVLRVAPTGKKVLLRIMTTGGRPKWVDTSVKNAQGKFFTWLDGTVNTTIPVFWDPTFLAKKKAMINALGAHFANNPAVAVVAVSFANAKTEDWNVPHTPDLVTQWVRLGYTTANMLSAGQQVIDTAMAAFPNQMLTLAVGGNGTALDGDEQAVPRGAVDAARATWGARLIVQKNDVSTCIPVAPGTDSLYEMIWDDQPDVGGQMLFTIYNDTTYKVSCGVLMLGDLAITTAVTAALAYGEKYVEIYEGDVVRYTTGIAFAHTALLGQP